MKYQIPQFLEIEDQIIGPLTLKQFLYVAGGAAVSFIIWSIIPIKFIAVLLVAPVIVFFLSLAFYKYNERPLINTVEYAIKYFLSDKLYIWQKKQKTIKKMDFENIGNKNKEVNIDSIYVPKMSDSKLKELTWSLDVKEKIK